MARPKAKKSRQAYDAGVDYAHDLISGHPTLNPQRLVDEARGGCLDLCGGDESDADWAFEGAQDAIRQHFIENPMVVGEKPIAKLSVGDVVVFEDGTQHTILRINRAVSKGYFVIAYTDGKTGGDHGYTPRRCMMRSK